MRSARATISSRRCPARLRSRPRGGTCRPNTLATAGGAGSASRVASTSSSGPWPARQASRASLISRSRSSGWRVARCSRRRQRCSAAMSHSAGCFLSSPVIRARSWTRAARATVRSSRESSRKMSSRTRGSAIRPSTTGTDRRQASTSSAVCRGCRGRIRSSAAGPASRYSSTSWAANRALSVSGGGSVTSTRRRWLMYIDWGGRAPRNTTRG